MDKRNVTSSFQGIRNGLYFLLLFSFNYHCQLVKGQLGEGEGRGGCGRPPPSPHRFMWDKTDKKLLIHMSMISNT